MAVASALLLAACVHREPIESSPDLTVLQAVSLPEPTRADLTPPDRATFVGPLDVIFVDVFNVPELTRELQVDASGRISMPLVGNIDAIGKTREELAAKIEDALRGKYLRNPQVTVNIRSSVSQVVTIDGQVTEPGLYPVTNQMTLMRALASAKGLTEYAKTDDVVILRMVNGHKVAGLYNLDAIRRGAYGDPPIYANDIITVGDSPARRMFRNLIAVSPLLTAPLIALLNR
ncbi:polysaccharide biosynthesis/export family protein [Sphingomonas sp. SORGH_AS_0870]|uniref:polysaccharide biosynthesis/export family protein n=1 Tax=Sphingomonas sp. SORGH_AS_0870 TaxID=3041801 RepID=UPI00286B2D07|nr:polysaccharide biosynthesis/export family protein [Sphingomonas sp. SORGH_AS_0870]